MEIQDRDTIQTELDVSSDLPNGSYELNLFDDIQKTQTTTEEGADQKQSNELESRKDLQKLSDETERQGGDELTFDNEIFGDILTKMKVFVDKSKQEKFETSDFILEWEILNDFLNLIDKYEKNLTDEDLSIVKRRLKLFIDATDNIGLDNMPTIDQDYLKKIFYMYFNLLNIGIIQNYLKNVEIPDHLKILCCLCISRIFEVMTYSCKFSDLGLNDFQRPINCMELLSLMLNYVTTGFKSSNLTSYPLAIDPSITNFCILSFLLWYSDKTILTLYLMEIGCSEIMIDLLTMICKTPDIHTELQLSVVVVIYNISRHDDGVKQLNDLNTSEVIKAYQSNCHNTKINIACYMTLVLLSTPEQIKNDSKRMNDVLDKLLEKVYDASISSDQRANGELHLSELLIVFVKLFNDDHTLDYIMEESQVDLHTSTNTEFFINQLIYYHFEINDENPLKQTTCTALVNILWSLSFQEKYKQQLKNAGTKFKRLIQNLTRKTDENVSPNEYVPKYIENIQKAAAGLLYNIDELIYSATECVHGIPTVLDNNHKPIIMISYSREDIDFCKQLCNEILKQGYNIWIDFKHLKTGDLWEQIAAGMKRANVIICLMSEDYYKSKSCRWEATYALDKLQSTKLVIPVFLGKHELPDWLEIRTAMLTFVRFYDLKQVENVKLFELIDMIEYSLLPTIHEQTLSLHMSVLSTNHESVSISMTEVSNTSTLHSNNNLSVHQEEPIPAKPIVIKLENPDISLNNSFILRTDQNLYPEKPIEQWNKNDISQWFQHNKIPTELRDLCRFEDGYELLDYAEIFLDTRKLQYQLYSNEFLRHDGITFGQRPLLLHEFTKFSNALRKLVMIKKST